MSFKSFRGDNVRKMMSYFRFASFSFGHFIVLFLYSLLKVIKSLLA